MLDHIPLSPPDESIRDGKQEKDQKNVPNNFFFTDKSSIPCIRRFLFAIFILFLT